MYVLSEFITDRMGSFKRAREYSSKGIAGFMEVSYKILTGNIDYTVAFNSMSPHSLMGIRYNYILVTFGTPTITGSLSSVTNSDAIMSYEWFSSQVSKNVFQLLCIWENSNKPQEKQRLIMALNLKRWDAFPFLDVKASGSELIRKDLQVILQMISHFHHFSL